MLANNSAAKPSIAVEMLKPSVDGARSSGLSQQPRTTVVAEIEAKNCMRGSAVIVLLTSALLMAALTVMAQTAKSSLAPAERTRVVILGVSHSAQLLAETYQPAVFRAFFNRVKPEAICIERSPQEFARLDFYEFTYEAQFISVPYAKTHGITLCPIDWLPQSEDSLLAWGLADIEQPPLIRNPRDFQGFINFADASDLKLGLFYSESESDRASGREWARDPAAEARADFPRRLFLYRTYMQAMRIRATAQTLKGKTILVVVGSFHKDDLEHVLGGYPEIEIVQPSTFGAPTGQEISQEITRQDLLAIAAFNLLGTQANTGNVNWDWMGRIVERLEKEYASPEASLLKTRLGVLNKKLRAEDAVRAYRQLQAVPTQLRLTFTGVKDESRVDSYFDPFGNLTIQQRAKLELARECTKLGLSEEAQQWKDQLLKDTALSELQRAQIRAYWDTYVVKTF